MSNNRPPPRWNNAAPARRLGPSAGRLVRNPAPPAPRSPHRRWYIIAGWVAAALFALLTVADLLSGAIWVADLTTYARVGVTVVALLLSVAAFGLRLFASGTLLATLFIGNVYLTLRPYLESEPPEPARAGAGLLKVATFDVVSDASLADFKLWIADKKTAPDVVGLQNMTNPWRTAAAQVSDVYPYRASALHGQVIKEELLSRYPITAAQVFHPAGQRTTLSAVIEVEGRPIRFVVMAPNKASTPDRWKERNQYMGLAAQWISGLAARGEPLVVMGDWNVTPWSTAYRSFLESTGLTAADRRPLPLMTHHLSVLPFVGISDDHIAVSRKVGVRDCATAADLSSDHLPVICRIAAR